MKSVPRTERLRQIEKLRREGLTYREMGERLGVAESSLRNAVSDPDGAKARERKKGYRGVCIECGGWTDGGNGRAKASVRCARCVRGERPSQPSARRTLPVKLTDISLDARLAAAWEANRIEKGDVERQEILLAALSPSDQVYWLTESARPILAQVAA